MEEDQNKENYEMNFKYDKSFELVSGTENAIHEKQDTNYDSEKAGDKESKDQDQDKKIYGYEMNKVENDKKLSTGEIDEESFDEAETGEISNGNQVEDDEGISMNLDIGDKNEGDQGEKINKMMEEIDGEEGAETETLEQLSQIKIKPAKSAWMLYMIANRERFKNENPTLKMAALTKLISESWKKLNEKGDLGEREKAPFIEEAEKDKARYREETHDLKERIKKAQIRYQLEAGGNLGSAKRISPPNFYDMNDSNIFNQQLSAIPLAKLKKIMKLDEEVKNISKDSLLLMDKALEYFVAQLGYETVRYCYPQRKGVKFDDLTNAIRRKEEMQFLKGDINSNYLKSISSSRTASNVTKSGNRSLNRNAVEESKSITKLSTFFNVKDKQ